jgi:hypothetical protein
MTHLNPSLVQIFGGENGDSFFVGLRDHVKATGWNGDEPTGGGWVHDEIVFDFVHVVVSDDANVVGSQVDVATLSQHQVPKISSLKHFYNGYVFSSV